MNLYPAIDLFEGKVVRLKRGDYQQLTVYSEDPAAIAKKWESQGTHWLHLVDLEGARDGVLKNRDALVSIRKAVDCSIEFGGGVRNYETIEELLGLGINRVVLGTKALDDTFMQGVMTRFGSRVAVGLDIRNGKVQTQGWLEEGGKDIEEALEWTNKLGVEMLIYTDIQKDGMLEGPNFEGLDKVLQLSSSKVILSGGVSKKEDVERAGEIKRSNFEGVIMGRAIYEDKFSVSDVVHLQSE